jgi:hypothetical protein
MMSGGAAIAQCRRLRRLIIDDGDTRMSVDLAYATCSASPLAQILDDWVAPARRLPGDFDAVLERQ